MMKSKIKKEIIFHSDKCTGCRICQLICSFTKLKRFSPHEAFIQIYDEYNLTPKMKIRDGCNQCGSCVNYCLYGALEFKEENT
jgi:carbon-monoxide dehydrogenase iron sulfur subunit